MKLSTPRASTTTCQIQISFKTYTAFAHTQYFLLIKQRRRLHRTGEGAFSFQPVSAIALWRCEKSISPRERKNENKTILSSLNKRFQTAFSRGTQTEANRVDFELAKAGPRTPRHSTRYNVKVRVSAPILGDKKGCTKEVRCGGESSSISNVTHRCVALFGVINRRFRLTLFPSPTIDPARHQRG